MSLISPALAGGFFTTSATWDAGTSGKEYIYILSLSFISSMNWHHSIEKYLVAINLFLSCDFWGGKWLYH